MLERVLDICSIALAMLGTWLLAFALKVRDGIDSSLRKELKIDERKLVIPSDVRARPMLFWIGLGTITLSGLLQLTVVSTTRPTASLSPREADLSRRREDFNWKEKCAAAADKVDKPTDSSVSEVFYSPRRNSCVCEFLSTTANRYADYSLADCLTRELLRSAHLDTKATDLPQQLMEWQKQKDALR